MMCTCNLHYTDTNSCTSELTCLYDNCRISGRRKHPLYVWFPITSCWVNWITTNFIKLQFGSQSSSRAKPRTLSIRHRDQIGKGWCAKTEFRDVSSIMRWNGKVWSSLSIWSLNPSVPLHIVGLLFFCLPYYAADSNAILGGMHRFSLWYPLGPLSSSLWACNTIHSIDLLGRSSHCEFTLLLWPKIGRFHSMAHERMWISVMDQPLWKSQGLLWWHTSYCLYCL